ncbi:TAXI family TRAP transporter solute-binding subunit [Allohahella marinimesophila]|uniref:TAXI family TRAP transporter solute-binding subunit n=1 Tax=Allohahella marinimesophila TaxID=1054972 RepID=A0ABP7NKT0_9GAMM
MERRFGAGRWRYRLLSCLLLIAALHGAAHAQTESSVAPVDTPTITIATGNETGVYFPAGGAICRLVNQVYRGDGTRCFIESTDGSIANLEALARREVSFAIVQTDWQHNAYHGNDTMPAQKSLRSVFSLHPEAFTAVVRADSPIRDLDDLKNRRVNVGSRGSGQRATIEILLGHLGWSFSDFSETTELPAVDQPDALCRGKIDVMLYVVGHPNGAVKEVTTLCKSRLIPLSQQMVKSLTSAFPYYRESAIPASMYRHNDEATPTFGVGAVLVTDAATDEETVYRLVKAVFENFEGFRQRHPALANLRIQDMASERLATPTHPGAARYFREAGLVRQ